MTIGEFLVIYERNHVARLKSRRGTSQRLQKYVGQLAAIPLGDLKKIQVLDWFHAIEQAKGGSAANRAIQDLHSLYVKASDWEIYEGKNPADRVKKFPKQSRERFVQSNELPWLLKALADEIPRNETYFPLPAVDGGAPRRSALDEVDASRPGSVVPSGTSPPRRPECRIPSPCRHNSSPGSSSYLASQSGSFPLVRIRGTACGRVSGAGQPWSSSGGASGRRWVSKTCGFTT